MNKRSKARQARLTHPREGQEDRAKKQNSKGNREGGKKQNVRQAHRPGRGGLELLGQLMGCRTSHRMGTNKGHPKEGGLSTFRSLNHTGDSSLQNHCSNECWEPNGAKHHERFCFEKGRRLLSRSTKFSRCKMHQRRICICPSR